MASITSSNTNGASVGYTCDDLNRLSTVVDNRLSGNNTTTYTYDPASNLATATYPNGLQSTFTYDPLNRLTAMTTPVSSYNYTLGPTGNRTVATEGTGRTLNWTYDGIYRLTNEAVSADPDTVNGSVAYGLDLVGNRLSETSSLTGVNSGSFGYNADDEVSSETYDNNGNTLTIGRQASDPEKRLTNELPLAAVEGAIATPRKRCRPCPCVKTNSRRNRSRMTSTTMPARIRYRARDFARELTVRWK